MDHRRLQRALFRMQHDPVFAAALRDGEAAAAASTGLAGPELAWLRAADPAAVSADRDGKRADQLLRNVTSEFLLSTRCGERVDRIADWARRFAASPQFHRAVSEDARLPLAFAEFAERYAEAAGDAMLRGLVALEGAMARARRSSRETPLPERDEVVLAGTAWLVRAAHGVFAFASALRAALDRGDAALPAPPRSRARRGEETLLVAAAAPEGPGRLRPVRAERLAPPVAAFLERARTPFGAAARAEFARARGIDRDELESVVKEFVAEGTLLRSPESS